MRRCSERRIGTVSAEFFDFFDARPAQGRFFGPAEDGPRRAPRSRCSAIAFWQAEFGGRDVVGQTLHIANIPCTIIGVAPKGFIGVPDRIPPAAFIPITTYAGYMGGPSDLQHLFTRYHWGWVSTWYGGNPAFPLTAASRGPEQGLLQSWNSARSIDPDLTPAELARPRAIAGAFKTAARARAGLEARDPALGDRRCR